MVDLDYVKKRRRKKIVAIASGVASMSLAVLIIVAFLGKVVGTFTVSIKQSNVRLAISNYENMKNPGTYLWVNHVPELDIFSNQYFDEMKVNDKTFADQLDTGDTDWHIGKKYASDGTSENLYFFKYTFFLQNRGNGPVNYTFDLNIIENNLPSNVGYGLDDILRVRLYENMVGEEEPEEPNQEQPAINAKPKRQGEPGHYYVTYAKRTKTDFHLDENGDPSYQEAISGAQGTPSYAGYAEEFSSEENICSNYVTNFAPGEMYRYTLVFWLEGNDPQAYGAKPENCSIKLGVTITADETEEDQ